MHRVDADACVLSAVIDGAHNPQAARALRQYVEECLPGQRVQWIIGAMSKKDVEGIVTELVRPTDSVRAVPVVGIPVWHTCAELGRIRSVCVCVWI